MSIVSFVPDTNGRTVGGTVCPSVWDYSVGTTEKDPCDGQRYISLTRPGSLGVQSSTNPGVAGGIL